MKKIISLLLALVMAVGCMLAVTSCGAEPELDFAVAEANLKLAGYSVNSRVFEDDVERVKTLSASKEISDDVKETIVITEYADATLAKLALEQQELGFEMEKKAIELYVEYYEHLIDEYASSYSAEKLADMKEKLNDYKVDLEMAENYVFGRSGNIVYYGTKAAIEATKGA